MYMFHSMHATAPWLYKNSFLHTVPLVPSAPHPWADQSVSNWILKSYQPHKVTSGGSDSVISKPFLKPKLQNWTIHIYNNKTDTHKHQTQTFKAFVPSTLFTLKMHTKASTCWYCWPLHLSISGINKNCTGAGLFHNDTLIFQNRFYKYASQSRSISFLSAATIIHFCIIFISVVFPLFLMIMWFCLDGIRQCYT